MIAQLKKLFDYPASSVDEQRKRGFFALFLLVITPTLFFFGVINANAKGMTLEVVITFVSVLFGILQLFALKWVKQLPRLYRAGVTFTLLFLTYILATGGAQGVAFLWYYFHPVAAFFLAGKKEGLFWVAVSLVVAVAFVLLNLGPYTYPSYIGMRFFITYLLVCILAYGLESSRDHFYKQLQTEKAALEQALQQVQTLQGLLPICASCKKIRDDRGYWHQVESYISEHSAVEFSHSICPECRAVLYPARSHRKSGDNPSNI